MNTNIEKDYITDNQGILWVVYWMDEYQFPNSEYFATEELANEFITELENS